MIPLALRLVAVFVVGVCLGSFVNWAIYALAWTPRPISPWSRLPVDSPRDAGRIACPYLGWLALRREADMHGRGFWIRPLLLEVGFGVALALLYWWEVVRLALIQPQVGPAPIVPPMLALHLQFFSHAILLCWMLAASFIDIDEKIIPDEITVTGTLLGLLIAAIVPMSLLPHVAEPLHVPIVGEPLLLANGGFAIGPHGIARGLEPVTPVAPKAWPPAWGRYRHADVARDRAWLLLAVVLRAGAANLARPARSGVCVGVDRQPIVARVSSRAAALAMVGGHGCDYVRLGVK